MRRGVNLLTGSAAQRRKVRNATHRWFVGITLVAVGQLSVALQLWRVEGLERSQCDALAAEYEPLRELADGNVELKNRIQEIVAESGPLLRLSVARPYTSLLAAVTGAALAADGAVRVKGMVIERDGAGYADATSHFGRLTLETICPPEADLQAFLDALDTLPLHHVEMVRSEVLYDAGEKYNAGLIHSQWGVDPASAP